MLESLGDYKILDLIGTGGLGEIYRARDTRLGRTVALRVLAPDLAANPERRERLLSRARAVSALSHPNIAALYEIGEDAGHSFLVYEFAAGEPLRAIIGGRPLSPRRVIDLGAQIADAMAEAHAQDIVYGGLTAAGVVVTPKGQAKILDAGLAEWSVETPRRPAGEGTGDHHQDIFSLGVLLYEMLTGKPFSDAVEGPVPGELGAIVARALKRGGDGYESAATLAAELRAVGAVLDVRAAVAEPAAVVVRQAKRSPAGWIWLALLITALAVVAWYLA